MGRSNSIDSAKLIYDQTDVRLVSVNKWKSFSDNVKSEFQLINSVVVRRIGSCIYTEVCGRNEIENMSDAPSLDGMRNKAVAIGSQIGLGELNWLGFTKAFLEPFDC